MQVSRKLPDVASLRQRREKNERDLRESRPISGPPRNRSTVFVQSSQLLRPKRDKARKDLRAARRLRDERSDAWYEARRGGDDVGALDTLLTENAAAEKKVVQLDELFERTALSKKPEALIRKELSALREKGELSPALVFREPRALLLVWVLWAFERRYADHSLNKFRRVLRRADCLFALIAIRLAGSPAEWGGIRASSPSLGALEASLRRSAPAESGGIRWHDVAALCKPVVFKGGSSGERLEAARPLARPRVLCSPEIAGRTVRAADRIRSFLNRRKS
jgi:hypothetical protein